MRGGAIRIVKDVVLRVGDLELDLVSRAVRRPGWKIDLLPREFQLLEYLVHNRGQIVPRAMLLQHVWDLHFGPMKKRTPIREEQDGVPILDIDRT